MRRAARYLPSSMPLLSRLCVGRNGPTALKVLMEDYRVKTLRVDIDGAGALTIRSLLDPQQYFDPEGAAEAAGISPANWPLFGLLWPTSQKLANLMQRIDLRERRILEIGCGLALASLVVHRREGNITASDCHPLTEAFLIENLRQNALPALNYRVGNWARANPALGIFDLIIGADVLYERNHPQQLADFIARHAARRAEVIIIDPNRGNTSAFSRFMGGHGFHCTETALDEPLADGSPYRGKALRYLREAA